MNISKKQLEGIGVAIRDARHRALNFQAEMEDSGRAAIAACAPILLGDPSQEEWASAAYGDRDESYIAADGKAFLSATATKTFLANLLRSVTQKPDAAIEAVKKKLVEFAGPDIEGETLSDPALTSWAKELIEAVRKADKEAAK